MKLPAVFAVTVSFFTAVAKDRPADIAAKEAFARLENAAVPTPQLSYDCALTQLEVMKKGNSQRRAVLPRDAYCRFLLAVTANDSGALQQAPGLLEKAAGDGRSNMAPLLAVLAALARHDAGALPTAIARVNCAKTDFVAPATCRRILDAAYIWTGGFERVPNTPWQAWARAQAQLEARQWSDAVTSLSEAAEPELASLTTLLAPNSKSRKSIPSWPSLNSCCSSSMPRSARSTAPSLTIQMMRTAFSSAPVSARNSTYPLPR